MDPKVRWFLELLKNSGRPEVFEITAEEARALNLEGQRLFAVEAPLRPEACPLQATREMLKSMPETLVISAEHDLLRCATRARPSRAS